jgi:hypothetical protein
MNIICITDGDADKAKDGTDLLRLAILKAVHEYKQLPHDTDKQLRRLNSNNMRPLGIQFIQIGWDKKASESL